LGRFILSLLAGPERLLIIAAVSADECGVFGGELVSNEVERSKRSFNKLCFLLLEDLPGKVLDFLGLLLLFLCFGVLFFVSVSVFVFVCVFVCVFVLFVFVFVFVDLDLAVLDPFTFDFNLFLPVLVRVLPLLLPLFALFFFLCLCFVFKGLTGEALNG